METKMKALRMHAPYDFRYEDEMCIRDRQSTSAKRQEGCWQHKLSVSGQDNK